MVPEMDNATKIASEADIFIVIGTSMQVYPAAGLNRKQFTLLQKIL
jgi:NAD-dependent deacetylase